MKNYLFALALACTIAFVSCDKIEQADDITFNTEFTIPQGFVVEEKADNPVNPYMSLSSSIQASQNAEYLKYIDRIKKIRVNKIKYTISEFSAPEPVTLTSGKAIFFEAGGSAATGQIASVSNLSLANGSGELAANQATLDKMGEILLKDGEIFVVSEATLSNAPVYYTIKVTLEVSITANSLK